MSIGNGFNTSDVVNPSKIKESNQGKLTQLTQRISFLMAEIIAKNNPNITFVDGNNAKLQ